MRHLLRDARFLISAPDAKQLGACHAEVTLVGRSNVGKSSLLNAVTGQPQLARISRTPGRTRLINVFLAGRIAGSSICRATVMRPGRGRNQTPGRP